MKKLYALNILSFLALFYSSAVFAQNENSSESINSTEWKKHFEKEFEISYPSNWNLEIPNDSAIKFYLYNDLLDENDQFSENINLLNEDISGHEISLDDYVDFSKKQLASYLDSITFISSETIINKNINHHKIVFTVMQNDFPLMLEQHYYLKNNIVYVLTYTSEASQYESFQGTVDKIIDSFTLK